ncbi:tyrosine-type recombinase/integrase [Roseiconus nitratireducens]|uniref:Tyrosine-type recombinase/integrase n=1 Tax=Roseiconus nitratireducens TaxID=2605748 RepID=A0A5M6DHH9_9BACT|nr:tyrosine-type recombinase/integrase [Roseiconus nitratireducens]KAA5546997.1 tyrosine-type recombinase/integrase [Roseiconus nitratireducens]
MASVFKRTHRKPIPVIAAIVQTEKSVPPGAEVEAGVASWTDRTGCKRTAIVDGEKIIVRSATWTNKRNQTITAPIDHTGEFVLQVDPYWIGDYRSGPDERKRRSTGTSDKRAAERIAAKWEADAQQRAAGVIDETTEKLAAHGATPLEDHLEAFISFRAVKGGTEDHRQRMRRHIREFAEAGKWKAIRDINSDDVSKHVETLKTGGSSARTIEARLQSVKSFTRWLANHHRLQLDPLSMVSKPDPQADRRYERRMLLPEEWPWLQMALQKSKRKRNGMKPPERLLLYRTAIQTGLRASELGGLTRGKMILAAETPHLLCKPAGTKNRKPAKQYIDKKLAGDLRKHVSRGRVRSPVFGIVSLEELSAGLESDLLEARETWLKSLPEAERTDAGESDFLTKTNHDNESLVFHSLRHTCGAWLALAGEHPKVVQTVMRHATITLTMDTYGHLFPGQTEQAPVKLAAIMEKPVDSPAQYCDV